MDNLPRNATEYRAWWESQTDIHYGYCWCGCGGEAPLSSITHLARAYFKGSPRRYIRGHRQRTYSKEYIIEDRGYKTPCWISQRRPTEDGYTRMHTKDGMFYTHRLFYERRYGPLKPEHELHHLCTQKLCCNPDHLEVIDHTSHMRLHTHYTRSQEAEVVALLGNPNLSQDTIAAKTGIRQSAVSKIWRRHFSLPRKEWRKRLRKGA